MGQKVSDFYLKFELIFPSLFIPVLDHARRRRGCGGGRSLERVESSRRDRGIDARQVEFVTIFFRFPKDFYTSFFTSNLAKSCFKDLFEKNLLFSPPDKYLFLLSVWKLSFLEIFIHSRTRQRNFEMLSIFEEKTCVIIENMIFHFLTFSNGRFN